MLFMHVEHVPLHLYGFNKSEHFIFLLIPTIVPSNVILFSFQLPVCYARPIYIYIYNMCSYA